jgi:hypothetical protein
MILKYENYLSERFINDLLLESRLVFSKDFYNIISKMKSNNIAEELIKLDKKDIDGIKQNYIDITDEKDKVSFTPDKKAQDLNKDIPEVFEVIQPDRYLTHSDKNNRVFEALGYDKTTNENWIPAVGTLGIVLAETTRPSGNTYVLFEEYDNNTKRLSVINKLAINLSNPDNTEIWKTSRNPMNVGRLVRSILKSSKVSFNEKELEEFVNQYKAIFDLTRDALRQFDIVSGNDIAYWYDSNRYQKGGGSLNNSCMGDVNPDFFDIYCYNRQVNLVILYDDNGYFDGEKYKSDGIKGRAILWDCEIAGNTAKFMDRIYTTLDSDVILFKQFAEKNGWWYKKNQNMDPDEKITDGKVSKSDTIIVNVDKSNFTYYPYIDTLFYISRINKFLTNKKTKKVNIIARETDGDYSEI